MRPICNARWNACITSFGPMPRPNLHLPRGIERWALTTFHTLVRQHAMSIGYAYLRGSIE
jgi:hypothetical protein